MILDYLFHWEQSADLEIKLGSRSGSGFGHEGTLEKTQGKSDITQKVLELVSSAWTKAVSSQETLGLGAREAPVN